MPIHISIVEDDVRLRGTLGRLIDSNEGSCCVNQHPSAENALAEMSLTQSDVDVNCVSFKSKVIPGPALRTYMPDCLEIRP